LVTDCEVKGTIISSGCALAAEGPLLDAMRNFSRTA
jgi:hypothetical protein